MPLSLTITVATDKPYTINLGANKCGPGVNAMGMWFDRHIADHGDEGNDYTYDPYELTQDDLKNLHKRLLNVQSAPLKAYKHLPQPSMTFYGDDDFDFGSPINGGEPIYGYDYFSDIDAAKKQLKELIQLLDADPTITITYQAKVIKPSKKH
jgi:hypothetical protein